MKKNLLWLCIVFSVVLNIVFVFTWGIHFFQKKFQPSISCQQTLELDRPCAMHRSIGVTEKQWLQIRPVLNKFSNSSKHINDSISGYRFQLVALLARDTVDTVTLAVLQENVLRMQKKLQSLVIEQILSEKNVFTPQQRGQLFMLFRNSGISQRGSRFSDALNGESKNTNDCKGGIHK